MTITSDLRVARSVAALDKIGLDISSGDFEDVIFSKFESSHSLHLLPLLLPAQPTRTPLDFLLIFCQIEAISSASNQRLKLLAQ